MKPELLDFIGLKSYSERTVVDFTKLSVNGLFGIFGNTGSGKSTIVDAVFYALYGEFPEDKIKNDDFVNKRVGYVSVEFVFSIADGGEYNRYRIKRGYYPAKSASSKATLSVINGEGEYPLAETTTSVTQKTVEILGLTLDQFKKCIVLPQGQFSQFLRMQKAERLKIVSALFGLEKYGERLRIRLSEKLKDFNERENRLEGRLSGYEAYSSEALKQAEEQVEAAKRVYEETNKILSKKEDEFKEFEKNYEAYREYCGLIERKKTLDALSEVFVKKRTYIDRYHWARSVVEKYDILEQKRKALSEVNKEYDRSLAELERLKRSYSDFSRDFGNERALNEKLAAIKTAVDGLEAMRSANNVNVENKRKRLELADEYKRVSRIFDEQKGNVSKTVEKLEALKTELSELQFDKRLFAAVEKISAKAIARERIDQTEFLKKLSAMISEPQAVYEIEKRLNEIRVAATDGGKDGFDDALMEIKALLEKKNALDKSIFDVNADLNTLKETSEKTANRLNSIVEQGTRVKEQIETFDQSYKSIIAPLTAYYSIERLPTEYSATLEFLTATYDNEKTDLESRAQRLEKLKEDLLNAENAVKRLKEKLEETNAAIAAEDDSLKSLLGEYTYVYAVEVFKSVDSYETLKREVDEYYIKVKSTTDRLEQLKIDGSDVDYSEQALEKLRRELEKIKDERRLAYKNYVELQKTLENNSQSYKEKCIIEKEFVDLKKERSVYDKLYEAVKYNKLTDYIADEYLSEMCFDAQDTLAVLSSGRYGLKYKGDFYVIDNLNGGEERKTTTVSGGELFLVSLSLALALSKSIIAKSNRPIEFFFLDEGFGSLDSELVELVMDSLEKLKNENFTIGLISHVETLKDRIDAKLVVSAPTETRGSTVASTV